MLERLRTFIHSHNLLTTNDRLILAVSGGLDSMVMLHMFVHSADLFQAPLIVLHVNHNQRGKQSDQDEALVKSVCKHYGLEFHSERLRTLANNASEDTMRQARYITFETTLALYPRAKLATAHHLDDQLETFLMRLAKGTSLKGLGSIPEKRDAFIRPMLAFRRSALEEYAQQNNVTFRSDVSNQDIRKLRNHIRKKIIPVLIDVFGDGFYAGFEKTLLELKDRQKNLTASNLPLFKSIFTMKHDNGLLYLEDYHQLSGLEKRDMFQYCVSHLDPLNYFASNDLWQSFDHFARQSKTGTQFIVSGQISVYKNRSSLFFTKSDQQQRPIQELFPDSSVDWDFKRIRLKKVRRDQLKLNRDTNREFFSGDKVSFPLKIRSWKNGDIFRPFGMKGLQKLSDFFINNKIDRIDKHRIPIVVTEDKILWVAGYRLDDRFKVSEQSKQIYELSITEEA